MRASYILLGWGFLSIFSMFMYGVFDITWWKTVGIDDTGRAFIIGMMHIGGLVFGTAALMINYLESPQK